MNGKKLKIALAASVALNLFVLGTVAGALGMRARLDRQPEAPAGNPLMRAGDGLPIGARRAYRLQLREMAVASRPKLEEARAARVEAARLMAQPQFDRVAVADALRRAREAEWAARSRVEEAMINFASSADAGQRQTLALGLQEPEGPGPGRDGGRGQPDRSGPGGGPPPPRPTVE